MSNLTLLAVQCKKSEAVDFKGPIYAYVASTYSEQQAKDAAEDLASVQEERNEVSGLTGSLATLASTLQRYYSGLSMMETRFPISKERDHVRIGFKWYDAFRPSRALEQYSIHYEKAAVLFNLGAVLTQQGLGFDRTTDAGLKDAARKFQEAAGVWAFLRDGPSLKVEQPRPVDISPECAAMLEKLCLAQAQECTFEKARQDKKNPNILARLARQVAVFYQDVKGMLGNPPLSQHFDRSWYSHATVKATLYEAETQAQAAIGLHSEQDVAPEIARIKEAQRILDGGKKDAKLVAKELNDALRILNETLGNNLLRADRENATVYLQRIPAFSDLPPIAPAALVKSIPPNVEGAREGLFTSVIPDGSAKALSKYTEMVDSVIRQQMDALGGASDDARLKLREWELPECLQALDAGSAAALPDGLRAELEQLEEYGGVRHLQELQEQIKELRRVAEEELNAVEANIKSEAAEDADLRSKYGHRWSRPASVALNSQITEKIAGYRANLAAAGESDSRLAKRLQDNASQLSSLSIDAAVSQMPRLQAPMVSTGDVEPATIVTQLRQALGKVEELSNERAGLEEALKVEKNRDNILPRIMASSGGYDALFKEEIRKYDKLKADTAENVQKQAQLMGVIGQNQAAYKQAFGYHEWRTACEAGAGGMRSKLAIYRELQDNMSEGLRFYMSLQEAIITLRQQAGDYVLTRNIQRDDLLEDFRRGNDEEARRQREAAEKAARDRAQASLAQLNMQTQGSAGSQGSWGGSQPQNYPPAPSWQQGSHGSQQGGKYGAPPSPPQNQAGTSASYQLPYGQRDQQYSNPGPYGGQQQGYSSDQNIGPHQYRPPGSGQHHGSGSHSPHPYQPSPHYPPPQQYYQHPAYYQAPQQQSHGASYGGPPQAAPQYGYNPPQGEGPPSSQGNAQSGQTYYNPFSGPPPPPGSQGTSTTQNPLW